MNIRAYGLAVALGFSALSITTVMLPQQAVAASEIKQNMKQMKQAYRKAMNATNIKEFAGFVSDLKDKTAKAAQYSYKPNDAKLSQIYKEGMQKLKEQYVQLDNAIKAGNLAQGKAVLQQIKDTERKYHKQLDV